MLHDEFVTCVFFLNIWIELDIYLLSKLSLLSDISYSCTHLVHTYNWILILDCISSLFMYGVQLCCLDDERVPCCYIILISSLNIRVCMGWVNPENLVKPTQKNSKVGWVWWLDEYGFKNEKHIKNNGFWE